MQSCGLTRELKNTTLRVLRKSGSNVWFGTFILIKMPLLVEEGGCLRKSVQGVVGKVSITFSVGSFCVRSRRVRNGREERGESTWGFTRGGASPRSAGY